MGQSRREFLTAAPAGLWAAATIAGSSNTKNDPRAGGGFKGSVYFFSKHLPDTTWRELAQRVKRLGFHGVDLTVRTGGHVLPEKGAESALRGEMLNQRPARRPDLEIILLRMTQRKQWK